MECKSMGGVCLPSRLPLWAVPQINLQMLEEELMAAPNTLQEIGKIQGSLDALAGAVEKTNKILMGNGQPGLYERTLQIENSIVDLEEAHKELAERHKEVLDGIECLAKSIGELKDSVELHHADKAQHTALGMVQKKEVVLLIVVGFILLHSIIPPDISLWSIVSKLLGL